MLGHGGTRSSRQFYGVDHSGPLVRGHRSLADDHPDPLESMGNLFDVAILIGVGFMIVALTGFGLTELLSDEQLTIVKNPGTPQMEIITKQGAKIERLKSTDEQAQGPGSAVGTVYRLRDGRMVWVPGDEATTEELDVPEGAVPGDVGVPDAGSAPGTGGAADPGVTDPGMIDPFATPDPSAITTP